MKDFFYIANEVLPVYMAVAFLFLPVFAFFEGHTDLKKYPDASLIVFISVVWPVAAILILGRITLLWFDEYIDTFYALGRKAKFFKPKDLFRKEDVK